MTESIQTPFFIGVLLLSAILILLILLLIKVNRLLKSHSDTAIPEFTRLLQNTESSINQGFAESRRELREVSADNRREIQENFKTLQDTLLRRISENNSIQTQQLQSFKTAFNDLSEKLISHSNEFQKSVSESFQITSEALNKKQDEFRDKTLERFTAFETTIKTDAKVNRDELNSGLKSFEGKFSDGIKAFNDQLRTTSEALNKKQDEFRDKTLERFTTFETTIKTDAKVNRDELNSGLKSFEGKFSEGIKDFGEQLRSKFSDLGKQQADATLQAKNSILEIKQTIEAQLKAIREDNTQQLTEMRKTVDEKLHDTLEKRLGESFKQVSDRLEQVHKGLGEMQTLAVGVGDLKKVLSNVKTRGILGEYQLGNILEQILSPDQYAVNVATKHGSRENVEYAIKLPGKSDEKTVWLPIDSKFPLETYQALLAAWEEGNVTAIDTAQKQLLKVVESFAKDISSKYIDPPHTTDFAIMFLPVESLYAEVLRHPEMFDRLQRTYRITITGPTTLSALLNSLNMGFRTLAVQKRSSEVWKVLAEVKTEFVKYSEQLAAVHKHINSASNTLETLQTTRTKAMERKLRGVETLELDSQIQLISTDD
ncbi:DNA recombination protein RmuC [Methylomonas koyamae]|uniref:Recombinase RmuC n=1 Tax=Methylomonas koyamae TaxID=702114 RepID=A0AA91DE40_9GAMM|nr:DNA recombination protein RmuC [Methylomonas koyamae]OAI26810.1 recombinase RmuC [Methylomonas koyamae]